MNLPLAYAVSPGVQRLYQVALREIADHARLWRGRLFVLPDADPFLRLIGEQARDRDARRGRGIAFVGAPAPNTFGDEWVEMSVRNDNNCERFDEVRGAWKAGQRSISVCRKCEHLPDRSCHYFRQFEGKHGLRIWPPTMIGMAMPATAALIVIDGSADPPMFKSRFNRESLLGLITEENGRLAAQVLLDVVDSLMEHGISGTQVLEQINDAIPLHELRERLNAIEFQLPSFRSRDFVAEEEDELSDLDALSDDERAFFIPTVTAKLRGVLNDYADGIGPRALTVTRAQVEIGGPPSFSEIARKPAILTPGHQSAWWRAKLLQHYEEASLLDVLPPREAGYATRLLRVIFQFMSDPVPMTEQDFARAAGCNRSTLNRDRAKLIDDVPLIMSDSYPWTAEPPWLGVGAQ